jgi:tight adherence protein C
VDFLNYILGTVQELSGDSGTGRMAFVALISIAAFMFCLAIMFLLSWTFRPEKERLRQIGGPEAVAGHGLGVETMGRLIASGGEKVTPSSKESRSRFQEMLIIAGYRGSNALSTFYGLRLLAMIALPTAAFVVCGMLLEQPSKVVFLFSLAGFILGLVGPALLLERKMKQRQKDISRGLPDALDLLVVCAEAGLGLKVGLQRVAQDIYVSHPALSDELALVNAQTRVGVDNVVALRDLADRTGVPEMRSLVAALTQSIRFGTNLADSLRIFSEEFRDRRVQAAEESAAMVSTKMLFPMILCIFPSFLLVAMGPPILGAIQALSAIGK